MFLIDNPNLYPQISLFKMFQIKEIDFSFGSFYYSELTANYVGLFFTVCNVW